MWYVEARKYGERKDYWYMSGLTQEEARQRHNKLFAEGWAYVHSGRIEERF